VIEINVPSFEKRETRILRRLVRRGIEVIWSGVSLIAIMPLLSLGWINPYISSSLGIKVLISYNIAKVLYQKFN
jgi:hypothetical protein